MSERILNIMDIRELIVHLRVQKSNRQVAKDTGVNRRTVQRYREWAEEQGLLEGALPPLEELLAQVEAHFQEKLPPQNQSSVEGYRSLIEGWVKANVEVAAMRQRLMERGYTGSYAAVWRFVRSLKAGNGDPGRDEARGGSPGGFRLCRADDRPGDRPTAESLGLCDDPFLEPSSVRRIRVGPESGDVPGLSSARL
jgi:transposase